MDRVKELVQCAALVNNYDLKLAQPYHYDKNRYERRMLFLEKVRVNRMKAYAELADIIMQK